MFTEAPQFNSVEELMDATTDNMVQAAPCYAFKVFEDKTFRQLTKFRNISVQERDFIYNELVLGNLVLMMLTLEAPDLRVSDEMRKYFLDLSQKVPESYIRLLRAQGVEATFLGDWRKLIQMRYDEYNRDRHNVRAGSMELESRNKKLSIDDLRLIQSVVPVQAVAIGCFVHVCHGETDGREELLSFMVKSFSEFYLEFRVRFEGGKITPLMRAKSKLKALVKRKLRGKPK